MKVSTQAKNSEITRKEKEKKKKRASIWYSSVRGEMKKLFRQWSEAKKKVDVES